jgi:RNA polymerase sigma-70 factor (ECF subfamily)
MGGDPVEPDDETIRRRIDGGDIAGAVDAVYRRYARDLRAFLRDQLWSDDAVDEVLAEVFKSLMHDLAGFRGDAKLRTWLRTVARHAMLHYLRRERTRADRVRPLEPADENRPMPELRSTYKTWIRRVYRELDEDDREMIDLWLEGWSWKDAADRLGATEDGLRKRFERLLRRINQQS